MESNLSGVGLYTPRMWYRCEVRLPVGWAPSGRVLLHFDAVDQEASVWLNGVPLGSHRGGYGRFTCARVAALASWGTGPALACVTPVYVSFFASTTSIAPIT